MLPGLYTLAAGANPLTHVLDYARLEVGGWFLFTNHMFMMLVAAGLMLWIFPKITKPYQDGKLVPTGTRNFFEALMMFVRDDIAKPVLGHQADRFMPFLWTLFFFILFNNLLGLLPLDAIQQPIYNAILGFNEHGHPRLHAIYGTATASLAVTAALAVFCFVFWNYHGIKANGLGAWAHHFLGGAPWYMAPVMVPVEILGMFVKPFALAIRLMANMTAGHVLLAVLTGTLALKGFELGAAAGTGISIILIVAAVAIMVLELFVAFLQAYLFTFLTTLFLSQLVVHEHDEEHHDEEVTGRDEAHESLGSGNLTDHARLPDAARAAGTHMAG
jgi:F-type H+-transporting ATPase subunit a